MSNSPNLIKLTGANGLRSRLILSMLSGRSIKINDIRGMDENPGLKDYEASLLRLADKMSNGVRIAINETGTGLRFSPGELVGGEIYHEVPISRSVVYLLEFAAALAPFCKNPLVLRMKGVTHDSHDNSIDVFKSGTLQVLQRVLAQSLPSESEVQLDLVLERRGVASAGDGSVKFTCPVLNKGVLPIDLSNDEGKVKRIRGVAWTSQISTQFSAAVIDAARGVLNPCLSDVWIYTDAVKGAIAPGYGVSLVAETDKGVVKCSSAVRGADSDDAKGLGEEAANHLLSEIQCGGTVDSSHQWLVVLFMALSGDYKISKAVFGDNITSYTIEWLKNIKEFLGVKFNISSSGQQEKIETIDEDGDCTPTIQTVQIDNIKLECIGVNLVNSARRTF